MGNEKVESELVDVEVESVHVVKMSLIEHSDSSYSWLGVL